MHLIPMYLQLKIYVKIFILMYMDGLKKVIKVEKKPVDTPITKKFFENLQSPTKNVKT